MKISIVSYRKNRNAELQGAEGEYLKRLFRHVNLELHAIGKWKDADGLLDRLLRGAYVVGLYIGGKQFTSEKLAGHLQQLMN